MAHQQATGQRTDRKPLWTTQYLLICAAQFLSYANNQMLFPVLPLYLTSAGYTPAFVGITFAAFSISSFPSRPFMGQGVDRWSPRGVYVLGALALGLASFSYLLPSIAVLLLGRTVHGLGWGAINTAGSTLVSESTPARRRGEALGYFGMAVSVASAVMPAVGLWMIDASGYPLVFVVSGFLGLAGAAAAMIVREAPRVHVVETGSGLLEKLIERRALLPSVVQTMVSCAYPITTVFVVLYARHRGIEEFSIYYLASGLATAGAQSLARLSDRWGRASIIAVGLTLSVVGLAVMMVSASLVPLVVGGTICAAGSALTWPVTMALAMDRTPPGRRGAAMGTFTAAFQLGNLVGSLLWGFTIEWLGYDWMFVGAIALLLVGALVLASKWQSAGGKRPGGAAV